MDGVLVDFTAGALQFHGKHLDPQEIRWEFPRQIGFGDTYAPDFWNPLGREFWENLDWTYEGLLLLAHLENYFGANITIISTPCETDGCADGKRNWVKKHIPQYSKRLFLGADKSILAGPNKVLIDDNDKNVETFRAAGGKAILVPRPWNCRRSETCSMGRFSVSSVMFDVVNLLESFSDY